MLFAGYQKPAKLGKHPDPGGDAVCHHLDTVGSIYANPPNIRIQEEIVTPSSGYCWINICQSSSE
jgi:hypothetical protein